MDLIAPAGFLEVVVALWRRRFDEPVPIMDTRSSRSYLSRPGIVMLQGALIGLVIGLVAGLYRAFVTKGDPCPQCGQRLPVAWFTPLRQCPACAAYLAAPATAAPSAVTGSASWLKRWPIFVPVLLGLTGLALIVLFLPGALESRRVWLYQQGRVDGTTQEIKDLQARNDPTVRQRIQELEILLRRTWHPEIYRDDYHQRMLGVYLGGILLLAALAIPLARRWRRTPAAA